MLGVTVTSTMSDSEITRQATPKALRSMAERVGDLWPYQEFLEFLVPIGTLSHASNISYVPPTPGDGTGAEHFER